MNGHKTDHLRNARFEASRTAKILTRVAAAPVSASGIIVLVAINRMTVKSRPDDVTVPREGELVRWLHRRPEVLSPEFRVRLAALATTPSTWGSETPAPDLAAFGVIRRTVQSARRVRLAWASATLLSVPLLAATTVHVLTTR